MRVGDMMMLVRMRILMLVRMISVSGWRRRRETMTWIFLWKGAKREVGLYTKENRPLTRMLKIAKMKMRTFVLPACREGQRWRWRGRGGGAGRGWTRWRSSKPAPSFSSSTSTWCHDVQMCHTLFQMWKQVNDGIFCQLYNHEITHLVTLNTLKSLRARRAEMPKEPALK